MILPQWRARIAAAEQRGYFSSEDFEAADSCDSCMVGERAALEGWDPARTKLTESATGVFFGIIQTVRRHDFDGAYGYLRTIEQAPTIRGDVDLRSVRLPLDRPAPAPRIPEAAA